MKNTIEKALQKQKEEAQRLSQQSEDSKSPEAYVIEKEDEDLKHLAQKQVNPQSTNSASDVSVNEQETVEAPMTTSGVHSNELDKALTIDLKDMEARGFVGLKTARNLINEEYREIKRKLLHTAFGPLASTISSSNIIMVSSARPSEGKTFTAINLALSIAAEQDKTVLLVDADVLKPTVLKTFSIEDKQGLMEYLLNEVKDLSDIIYHTNIPKLKIMPAGQTHHLSTELLASTVMKETVEEFSTRYPDRVVIIDAPPLIGINETAVLANLAGQAVIVVEEGKSKLNDIRNAVDRLNPDMAIGFVVNKSTQFNERGGYYGYMYYGSEYET